MLRAVANRCLVVACALILAAPLPASAYALRPAADWVETIAPGAQNSPLRETASGGAFYLLVDRQVRLAGRQTQNYRRFVAQATSAQGLDEVANIQIYFNPAFEQLTLHSLKVTRDGDTRERLHEVQFNVLQRETDLEYLVYDEGRTASAFLKDIRVGDTVDYAYTVEGSNPVFGDNAFGRAGLQFTQPVARVHLRLLHPERGSLNVVTQGDAERPGVRPKGGAREESWNLANVAARTVDAGSPSWHDPYPAVSWTSFSGWSEVVDWARPLYQVPAALPVGVKAQVDQIRAAHRTPAAQAATALRWVQSEIRYLAIAIGTASHAPNSPEQVMDRRFGDCKDKTLLLLTLLDALGIEAYPALVNTDTQRALARYAPSPVAFDHVLVMARIDGTSYWLDPTRNEQKGTLDQIYQPDFDLALVVKPGVAELQAMNAKRVNQRHFQVLVDASDGFDGDVELTVTTTTEGAQTDKLRSKLATSNLTESQQSYLNFYAAYYPGISIRAPIEVQHSASGNQITLIESYRLGNIATLSEETERFEAPVYAPDLLEYLAKPELRVRNAPLEIEYPLEVTHLTRIKLPEPWSVDADVSEVEDPAFSFRREVTLDGDVVTLSDRFTTLVDHIAADDVARYADNLAKARHAASFEFSWPKTLAEDTGTEPAVSSPHAAALHPGAVAGTIAAFALAFGVALLLYRFDPHARHDGSAHALQGMGGWLILPAIGVVLMPFIFGYALYDNYSLLQQETWVNLDAAAGVHADSMRLMLAMTLGLSPLLLAISLVLTVVFFQRRTSAPWIYVALLVSNFAMLLAEYLFLQQMESAQFWTAADKAEHLKGMLQTAFRAAIWIPYFLVSQRVRVTFIRRRHQAPSRVGGAVAAESTV